MERAIDQFKPVRFAAAALCALATAFLLAACGGGGSGRDPSEGTSASAPAISKASLIRQADAICRRTDEVQRRTFNAYSKKHELVLGDSPEMRKVMKNMLLPPIEPEIEEIAALGVPPGDEDELARIIGGWEKAVDEALKQPAVVLRGGEGPFTEPDRLAARYGFDDCAKAL